MAKHGLTLKPDVKFGNFIVKQEYHDIIRFFFKQNIYGFSETDLLKRKTIEVNEFDTDSPLEPPFMDTAPEIVEKDLLKDYLEPLIEKIEIQYAIKIQKEYDENLKFSNKLLVHLQEKHIVYLESLEEKIKPVKHLGGAKKPILSAVSRLKNAVNYYFDLTHINNPDHNKIKLNLNKKETAQLLLILNNHEIFYKKLKTPELAELASIHFKYKVGKNYNEFNKRSAGQELSRAPNESHSDKLLKLFKDYIKIIKKLETQKKDKSN